MSPVRENLFEANLNLPQEYLDKVRREAQETIGTGGPSRQEMGQMQNLMQQIVQIQRGHEDELSELGTQVIRNFYGAILDGVELDLKIVDPDDEEKLEMAQKMLQQPEEEEEQQEEEEPFVTPEVEIDLGIDDEVDKRKLINNVMQGEAQNVHDMMFSMRDQVTEITGSDQLLDYYIEFLNLNRKFDWDDRMNLEDMMAQAPQMANAMETEWEDDDKESDETGEEGTSTPKIKARVLDLPMIVHEGVKGIYELIAAGAIDPDESRAEAILKATDSLTDEKEDIKYGPFIARDIRNYVNKVAEKVPGTNDIPNLREFVFGEMITLPAEKFVELVKGMLMDEEGPAKTIGEMIDVIKRQFDKYKEAQVPGFEETEEDLPTGVEDDDYSEDDGEGSDDLVNFMKGTGQEKTPTEPEDTKLTKKDYASMNKAQLNNALNDAIDTSDWEAAKEIQEYIGRMGKQNN